MNKSLSALLVIALSCAVAQAQTPAASAGANPELVGALAKELGSTPQQAEGAAGALFSHAKTKLKPEDWTKVAAAVPGMDGLLKAAPAAGAGGLAAVSGLAGVASSFSKLGLKPELVAKAIPVLTSFVTKSGGAGVGQLLAGVLK